MVRLPPAAFTPVSPEPLPVKNAALTPPVVAMPVEVEGRALWVNVPAAPVIVTAVLTDTVLFEKVCWALQVCALLNTSLASLAFVTFAFRIAAVVTASVASLAVCTAAFRI